jgi:undecaprenyl-diphosphatase
MEILNAAVLGLVQGLTEFLPISSSGHLFLIPKIFYLHDFGLSFDAILHLGTLIAVIFYFRRKISEIIKALCFKTENKKASLNLILFIILATIPAGLAGIFFGDAIEATFRNTNAVAASLIFWGIILAVAERYNNKIKDKINNLGLIGWKKSLFIGCAQIIALIPGASRSGLTISAGLFSKLDKENSAEFSFLLSIPIIAGAGGLHFAKIISAGFISFGFWILLIGFLSAAVSGFFAIWFLMKIIKRYSFMPFVIYRVLLGVLILLLL